MTHLQHSRALWNRTGLQLASDEVLAQLLDRGDMSDWRELYGLMRDDLDLRRRVHVLLLTVPLPLPHFWLAALKALGENIDLGAKTPDYFESGP